MRLPQMILLMARACQRTERTGLVVEVVGYGFVGMMMSYGSGMAYVVVVVVVGGGVAAVESGT